jgi:hypothetical protein
VAVIGDYSAARWAPSSPHVAQGSTVVSDGWSGYARLKDVKHHPTVVGETPAHQVLPWTHSRVRERQAWALGVYHGLRTEHLQA